MTTVAILPEGPQYRAVAGKIVSTGRTPGEALDALTAQLDTADSGTLVIVQQFRPDRFFTAAQQQRLADLMNRWRTARDAGGPWSPAEQTELDSLVQAELKAAGERAEHLIRQLAP